VVEVGMKGKVNHYGYRGSLREDRKWGRVRAYLGLRLQIQKALLNLEKPVSEKIGLFGKIL
jgi:hypothetical protein